ncbi:MAG: CPBP family intramembrane glutamic endopeptidase [Actinomycetota bacterium]
MADAAAPPVPAAPDLGGAPPRPDGAPARADRPVWPFATWGGIDLVVVGLAPFGLTLVAEIVLVGIFGLRGGGTGVLVTALQQVGFALLPVAWVRAKTGSVAALGLGLRSWTKADVFAGIGAGVGAVVLGGVIIVLTQALWRALTGGSPAIRNPVQDFGDRWVLPSAALAVFMSPFCEEILFRGFVFGGLRRRLRFVWAGLASASLFGLAHADPVRFVGLATMGFVLAAAYERRKTLTASIAAHFTANLLSVLALLATRGSLH